MTLQFIRAKGFRSGYEEPILNIPSWNSNNFFNNDWTYEVWFKPTIAPSGDLNNYLLNFQNKIAISYREWYGGTWLRVTTQAGDEIAQSTGVSWTTSVWRHLAVVKNQNTITFYMNGVQVYTETTPITAGTGTSTLSFGTTKSSLQTEIRLWSVARTASEIVNNYRIEVPANSPGLNLLYRFTDIPIPVDYSGATPSIIVPNLGTAGSSMNSIFYPSPPWISDTGGIYEVTDHPYQEVPSNSNILIPSSQTTPIRTQLNITLTPSSLETASNTTQSNWAKVLAIYTSLDKKPAVVTFRPSASTIGRFRASSAFSASYSLSKIAIIHTNKSITIVDRSVINNPSSMDITTT